MPHGPCEATRLQAVVDAGAGRAWGTAACLVRAPGALRVAAYPELLADQNVPGLDDVTAPWLYPDGFGAARMALTVAGRAVAVEGGWTTVAEAVAGQWLEVGFSVQVPPRRGPFGRRGDTLWLLGGWHPAFAAADGPIRASRWAYDVTLPDRQVGLVGAQPVGHDEGRRRRGHFTGRFLPVASANEAAVRASSRAVLWAPAHRDARLPPGADEILATVGVAASFAANLGLRPDPLLVVVAPLRQHLAVAFDGGLLVSERAFQLMPAETLQRFHRLSLWREQMAAYARPHAEAVEDELPPAVAADAVGAGLRGWLLAAIGGGEGGARDLLERIAVVPDIDALLFAPQVGFVDSYFNIIDETGPRREALDDFDHSRPRGKILFEKVRDRAGDLGAGRWALGYLRGRTPLLVHTRAAMGPEAAAALALWSRGIPRVNYRLAEVAQGASGTTAAVAIEGPDAAGVHEPVTIEVRERGGGRQRQVVVPPARAHFAASRAAAVEVDPDVRQPEWTQAAGLTPRFDNRRPRRWRLLLDDISGTASVTRKQVLAAADASLRRIDDLRQGYDLSLQLGPGMWGGRAGAAWRFGRPVTGLRLAQAVSASLGLARLRPEATVPTAGDQLSIQLRWLRDGRLRREASFRGWAASVDAVGATARQAGEPWRPWARAGVAGLKILPLGLGCAWLTRVRFDQAVGPVPGQSLLRLGGRYQGSRGYDYDEERGRRRLLVSGELRHTLAGTASHNLFGLAMLSRLEAAAFADAVYLPVARDGCRRDWFVAVGYGLRLQGEALGVSPMSLQLDLGVPLRRCPDQRASRTPVGLTVAFIQSFWSF